jgi:solute carrier family 35 protein E3
MGLAEIIEDNAKPIMYAAFNIFSVMGIVGVNKRVFKTYNFHFPITLVMIHCIITFLGLFTASVLGVFERKQLPVNPRLILAGSFVFYNCASLVNLNVNTVGFYQISKILVTPTVMLLNLALYGEGTTTKTKMAVGIMLVGVTLATVTDVDVGMTGFLVGMLAVIGAAQQQILIGKIQKSLNASSNQLLVSYTPFVVVMLACCTPIDMQLPENKEFGFDSYSQWYNESCSTEAVITIALSGCLGMLVSLSTFLMIGATSPLTYNIVGHLKTVGILTMGVMLFGDSMSMKKFFGIAFALTGVVWYSLQKLASQQSAKKAAQSTPTKA